MKPILRVLSGKPTNPTPIWLMRQAGRYLPEYRALRAKAGDFLKLCFTPSYATEITIQPIKRFEFDAAILFSDILVIPHALGQKLWFVEGEGPKLASLEPKEFSALNPASAMKSLSPIFETVANVKAALPPSVTLIGFAGAPWTVANYMIAGGSSDESEALRKFSYQHPDILSGLFETLIETTAQYLIQQVNAGAEVLQIFESWAGTIPAEGVQKYSIDPIKKIIEVVRSKHPSIPFIVFPRAAGANYKRYAAETGANAISVDYQTALSSIPNTVITQGNLDPIALTIGGKCLEDAVSSILNTTTDRAHIFNLGHGIRQDTPIENVELLLQMIRARK